MNTRIMLDPTQLLELMVATVRARVPLMVVSSPGEGKTALGRLVADELDMDLVISHPAVEDPTDSKGIPWGDADGDVDFRPIGQVRRVLQSTRPTLWIVDDFGQAPPAVQAPYLQWMHGGECGGFVLPDHVVMIIFTNKRTDKAGVGIVLEPIKSRAVTIVYLQSTIEAWVPWASAQRHIPDELIAFLRFKPELLSNFQPSADLDNSPSPRTWEHAGILMGMGLSPHTFRAALVGAVGEGAATELIAFLRLMDRLPSIDGILADPRGADIPSDVPVLTAVATALGRRASRQTFGAIAEYAQRLVHEDRGEFAALLLRDAIRNAPEVTGTAAYVELVTEGELAETIGGATSAAA